MSDFDVKPSLSSIVKLTPEESDACDAAYGKFDLEASIRETEEQAAREDAEAQPQVVVPAEETPDDAPPL